MHVSSSVSKAALWTGRVMSVLPVLLILFGSVMKLMKTAAVVQAFADSGLPERLIIPVGVIELACVVVYLIPRTAVLGAILMTGFAGGSDAYGTPHRSPHVSFACVSWDAGVGRAVLAGCAAAAADSAAQAVSDSAGDDVVFPRRACPPGSSNLVNGGAITGCRTLPLALLKVAGRTRRPPLHELTASRYRAAFFPRLSEARICRLDTLPGILLRLR